MKIQTISLAVVTILKDGEFPSFKEVLDTVIREKQVKKFIVASLDTKHMKELLFLSKLYKEKLVLINCQRLARGEALFRAYEELKKYTFDYVLMLDGESAPEDNWVELYLSNLKYFKEEERERIIMIGNTVDIFDNENTFYQSGEASLLRDDTLFDLLSFNKLRVFFKHFVSKGTGSQKPVFKTVASIGNGAFIPYSAILKTESPDRNLSYFGEDTDFAWKIKKNGYSFFKCTHPVLRKPSTKKEINKSFNLFSDKMSNEEVYRHMMNSVVISRRHSSQNSITLFCNIMARIFVVFSIGLIQAPVFKLMFKRMFFIAKAVVDGYKTPLKNNMNAN